MEPDIRFSVSAAASTSAASSVGPRSEQVSVKQVEEDGRSNVVELRRIYTDRAPKVVEFGGAALAEALQHCQAVSNALDQGDAMEADDLLNRVQAIIAELYYECREATSGLRSLLVCTFHGLENRERGGVERQQVDALKSVLREARRKPFMSMMQGAELQMALEDAGYDLRSRGLAILMPPEDEPSFESTTAIA
jgi:hypothetical protein